MVSGVTHRCWVLWLGTANCGWCFLLTASQLQGRQQERPQKFCLTEFPDERYQDIRAVVHADQRQCIGTAAGLSGPLKAHRQEENLPLLLPSHGTRQRPPQSTVWHSVCSWEPPQQRCRAALGRCRHPAGNRTGQAMVHVSSVRHWSPPHCTPTEGGSEAPQKGVGQAMVHVSSVRLLRGGTPVGGGIRQTMLLSSPCEAHRSKGATNHNRRLLFLLTSPWTLGPTHTTTHVPMLYTLWPRLPCVQLLPTPDVAYIMKASGGI